MGRPSKYPLEFRREAAQLVLTSDRSMADIARELGVHHKTLGNWVSDERRRRARAADPASVNEAERDELRRLRKEVAELRMEALEDIARFVGHAKPSTTAGYVKRLGRRPQAVAKRAASVIDGQALDDTEQADGEGSESRGPFGSNAGSYGPESTQDQADDRGQ